MFRCPDDSDGSSEFAFRAAQRGAPPEVPDRSGHGHGVSWAAVFAGATGAAALSLILLILGVGLGLSSISPWASRGASAQSIGAGTIVWITFTALAASGVGGYLAGRLRSTWLDTAADEVYFRDTAHGFLAWAVATLITAGFLSSSIGAIVGGGAEASGSAVGAVGTAAASSVAGGAGAMASKSSDPLGYFTDSLFRPAAASSGASAPSRNLDAGAPTSEVAKFCPAACRPDHFLPRTASMWGSWSPIAPG